MNYIVIDIPSQPGLGYWLNNAPEMKTHELVQILVIPVDFGHTYRAVLKKLP